MKRYLSRAGFAVAVLFICIRSQAVAMEDDFEEELPFDNALYEPTLIFHASLDGSPDGVTKRFKIPELSNSTFVYEKGVSNKAVRCETNCLKYPARDVIYPDRGSLTLWYRSDKKSTYRHNTYHQGPSRLVNGCLAFDSRLCGGKDEKWHHWTLTWDNSANFIILYKDGALVKKRLMPHVFKEGKLRIGYGLRGLVDSIHAFDGPLTQAAIKNAIERVRMGKPEWPAAASLKPGKYRYPLVVENWNANRPPLAGACSRAPAQGERQPGAKQVFLVRRLAGAADSDARKTAPRYRREGKKIRTAPRLLSRQQELGLLRVARRMEAVRAFSRPGMQQAARYCHGQDHKHVERRQR